MREDIVQLIRLLRLNLAILLFGGGWGGIVTRLWLIRERAMAAVTPEGGVILAECKALADALYEPIPGNWRLDITHISEAGTATPATTTPEKA